MRLLIRWGILTIAFAVAEKLLSNMHVTGGIVGLLVVAAVFGLVNAILGPILRLLSLPITILTAGLFALIVNAVLLGITAKLTSRLAIHGFWTWVWAALIITLVSAALNAFMKRGRRRGWAFR
jgi:putative membrane protein